MYFFFIKEDEMLEKCNKNWDNKFYGGIINTCFLGNELPVSGVYYISFLVTLLDSVFKNG